MSWVPCPCRRVALSVSTVAFIAKDTGSMGVPAESHENVKLLLMPTYHDAVAGSPRYGREYAVTRVCVASRQCH